MLVNREFLKEYIYNVLLWTPGKGDAKKSISGGRVEVSLLPETISFLSTDGYVAVQTGSSHIFDAIPSEVSGEDLKLVLKAIGEIEEEDIQVTMDNDHIYFGKTPIDYITHNPDDLWNSIRKLVDPRQHSSVEIHKHFSAFYLDPKRLSKFSLLEPKLEYPLAMAPSTSDISSQPTILWKYGSGARGVLAPLTVELLEEAYAEDLDEVMW